MSVLLRPTVTGRVAWSVCRLVCHNREPYKNGWTDPHAVWNMDSGGPKEACVRWGCTLAQPSEYRWTVHVRRQCGLMSNYFDHWGIVHFGSRRCPVTASVLSALRSVLRHGWRRPGLAPIIRYNLRNCMHRKLLQCSAQWRQTPSSWNGRHPIICGHRGRHGHAASIGNARPPSRCSKCKNSGCMDYMLATYNQPAAGSIRWNGRYRRAPREQFSSSWSTAVSVD